MSKARSLEGVLVKKPHTRERFTEQQLAELVACSDDENGHHYFMQNFFYIQHPVKGKLLFEPFDYQVRLLDSYHNYRNSICVLSRQCGKCFEGKSSIIRVRNKTTGEVRELPIQEFFEMQRNSKNN